MPRPTLRTERLVLEPMSWDHLADLCALDADPEVMRFLGPARTADEVQAKMPERLSPTDDALGLGFWSGFEHGRFVGWWCLSLEGPELAEVGWRLHTAAWGRGLATEGARLLLDHGFGTVGLEVVIAETLAVNAASRGVMRKLGMTHESTETLGPDEPENALPGADQGMVRYEIGRSAWTSTL